MEGGVWISISKNIDIDIYPSIVSVIGVLSSPEPSEIRQSVLIKTIKSNLI